MLCGSCMRSDTGIAQAGAGILLKLLTGSFSGNSDKKYSVPKVERIKIFMKKAYAKPMLLVERFELTQRLTNCSVMIGFQNEGCVIDDDDASWHMKDLALMGYFQAGACADYPKHSDADQGMCWHTSVNLAFSS